MDKPTLAKHVTQYMANTYCAEATQCCLLESNLFLMNSNVFVCIEYRESCCIKR